ncbi:helix-turn-helix domain-containing protein [Frankia sp. AgB1.9]|uniref:helix-turn-helix domain-containing protein n=1 Tax=unclassified Frankia TaxID=2632575 RepID=UPI0019319B26|nr:MULTISPECIES: helix-turn-helix domain-containing protein [unclassified Frankia]MBL7487301.1 helix-turn-helix domain-containing protein [Frankia sp. AgW1.1]MBL7546308.1 helix-turn-helix domain-containing protein [Frankia sp. AgB1.9]MBL7618647.1 helix-turn-helix domain-containing protein [Frankia sp. AgB1.8]
MANITNARQFGAEVREARNKQGLSQENLAAQAGVSRAWLARFETGHPTASVGPLFRVLAALDLSLDLVQRTVTEAEAAVLAALAARAKR